MSEIFGKITIIIPTFNRYPLLLRLLKFYASFGFPAKILILDSSSENIKSDELKILLSNERISYKKFDSATLVTLKIAQGLKFVATPYVVICADDDFIIPSGIEKSVVFMENNPDFSIVQGLAISHEQKREKNGKNNFGWIPTWTQGESIEFNDPSQRLVWHLTNYFRVATFYGVHKTQTLQYVFDEALGATAHGRLAEVLLTALTLIFGKMKILPVFYCSREAEGGSVERKYKVRPYFYLPWSVFLKTENFEDERKNAIACLARNLQKQGNLKFNQNSKELAQKALDGYLISVAPRFFEKARSSIFRTMDKILPSYSEKFMRIYLKMNKIKNRKSLEEPKKQYLDILGKNDLKFRDNLNKVREAVESTKFDLQ